jgi:hypothetical protein
MAGNGWNKKEKKGAKGSCLNQTMHQILHSRVVVVLLFLLPICQLIDCHHAQFWNGNLHV